MSPSHSLSQRPVLRLAVPSPLRRSFDYWPPIDSDAGDWSSLQPGMRVLVPFGRRRVVAVLLEVARESQVDATRLKCALQVLDPHTVFSAALMRVFLWAAAYYQHPVGEVFATLLPVRLRQPNLPRKPGMTRWQSVAGESEAANILPARARRQRALWQLLREHGPMSQVDIESAGFNSDLLRRLENAGLASREYVETYAAAPGNPDAAQGVEEPLTANSAQQTAIELLNARRGEFGCYLLDGITGSGKTEVYLRAIEQVIADGRQALMLVPEISLTPQTISRFRRRFSCEMAVLHSGLTDTERYNNWHKAASGDAGIVIGTRSAVFTPLARPGIIIIDEEHDLSFKQQDGFRYSARDLAIVRGREENFPVVLGSATPALESLLNARSGKFTHLVLNQRASAVSVPKITLEDISRGEIPGGFSTGLLSLIDTTLAQGNQVLVFINRRGFAPALLCQDCGWISECDHCDAQLTVHKTPPLLRCHHCDSQRPIPAACPQCQGHRLTTRGVGTEKSEHFLQQRYGGVPIIRIDRDTTRRRDSLETLLQQVASGEPAILVGTQMLAKGHHFPKVNLAAILDADTGLFSPDFRGQEQMAQLLLQVSGRAGREEKLGRVVIQTRHPSHVLLQTLLQQDYHALAEILLEDRRDSGMPPYSHLALFRAESSDVRLPAMLLSEIRKLCDAHQRSGELRVTLSGPLPAPMERRAGRYRMQLLLQSNDRSALQRLLTGVTPQIEGLRLARKLRWSIDVDPLELI